MASPNSTDYILHFIQGACNPILVILAAATSWNSFLTPLYVIGMLYGGVSTVIALRKKLIWHEDTPDPSLQPPATPTVETTSKDQTG